MSRRLFPLALLFTSAAVVYACSDSSETPPTSPPVEEAGVPVPEEAGPTPEASTPEGGPGEDGGENLAANPIEGVAAAKLITDLAQYSDGPQVIGTALYVALPFATNVGGQGPGLLVRMNLDGSSASEVRAGDGATSGPVGNSVDKQGNLITAERTKVTRTVLDGGAVSDIATTYLSADGGTVAFDRPNDLVARVIGDGTIYVTDPSYGAENAAFTNNLIRIAPDGGAVLAESFANVPRPNGIALSPDEKILYVSFSRPLNGTKPFIRKYTVNPDGTLKDGAKFVELPTPTVDEPAAPAPNPNDDPDGLAVDKGGNIYVAWRKGINVYKADGTRYGAEPSVAIAGQIPTGLTFGGAGAKTLFVTTQSGKIYTLTTKVTGVAQ